MVRTDALREAASGGRARVVAHRGASALAPENTFGAFDLALELGADALETDLQVTRDGVVVCIHDDTLERTTSGRGRVEEVDWDDVRRLDAGEWFDARFVGERVPRLEAFVERYAERTKLHLELKTPRAIDAVAAALRAVDPPRVEVSSFEPATLGGLERRVPQFERCLLVERWDLSNVEIPVRSIGAWARELNEMCVREAHARGMRVRAWCIDTRDEARRLRSIRVDELTLDDLRW